MPDKFAVTFAARPVADTFAAIVSLTSDLLVGDLLSKVVQLGVFQELLQLDQGRTDVKEEKM